MRLFLCATIALFLSTPAFASLEKYTANLQSLNNSGVTGTATVTLNGSDLTFELHATGLEVGHFHQEHLHGFLNPNDMHSQIPKLPQDDKNGNGLIDDIEGDATMGNEMVYLTKSPDMENIYSDFPMPDSHGVENFKQTYDVSEQLPFLKPLDIRGVELHGMTVDGKFVAEQPVAAGLLRASGGSSSGGNVVPLPPAALAGGATMILFAGLGLVKKRFQST